MFNSISPAQTLLYAAVHFVEKYQTRYLPEAVR